MDQLKEGKSSLNGCVTDTVTSINESAVGYLNRSYAINIKRISNPKPVLDLRYVMWKEQSSPSFLHNPREEGEKARKGDGLNK